MSRKIEQAYKLAKERYAAWGVNTDKAMARIREIPVSMHCWQGDDVGGFEKEDAQALSDGGLMATGNYPGKARTPDQLRMDATMAMSLIPGRQRFNLHALYAEFGGKWVDRDALEYKHFANWVAWAKELGIGIDFNSSYFAHPKAADGVTLTHPDKGIRQFWIDHGIVCRQIAGKIGKALGNPVVTNVWIPDGSKDTPVDRLAPRQRLEASLDAIFAPKVSPKYNKDAVECKLFGIGSESYVAGSHEFYMGYAVKHNKLLCLDAGHFHPTETISDKISSVLMFVDEILLHVSRGIRWDSDHVVILNDDLRAIAQEILRYGFEERVHIGLDFFDASINRIAAWVIGMRAMGRALLLAALEPTKKLAALEKAGDNTARLALLEEMKGMPANAVWDYYCLTEDVPVGSAWLDDVKMYEKNVLARR